MPAEILSPTNNPGAYEYMQRQRGIDGKEQKALRIKRESLKMSLEKSGSAKPATILNFNPVALRIEGGIQYKVPSAIDTFGPPEQRLAFAYKGKKYRCSLLTIGDPFIYPIIRDVTLKAGMDPSTGIGKYDVLPCRQIEIAHNFWTAYNYGAPDSSGMGGVVVFEGDRHAIKHAIEGKDCTIHVPTFVKLPSNEREYFTEPKSFMEVLGEQLDRQRSYADRQMLEASMHNNTETGRNNITSVHRIWHQYELDMGFVQKVEAWLLNQTDPEETCKGCGAGKKRAEAYFCQECGRAYDVLKAYMDKEIGINHDQMNRLRDEDWPIVRKEEKRRQALRTGEPEPKG